MMKSLLALFLLLQFAHLTHSFCNITEIKNVTTNQLMFSGNVSYSSANSLFFVYYGVKGVTDREQLNTHPTMVVFGNPGSSSHYLNFGTLGPLLLSSNLSLVPNPNSVTQYANVLFLDPPGSGFSFLASQNDIPKSYVSMAQQVASALLEFKKSSELGKGKWIFVGESSWIRAVSGFQDLDSNLIGIVSLSPWGDLYDIGKYYGVAGVELGILTAGEKNSIESTFTTCYLYLRNGKYTEAHQCYDSTLNFVELKTNNRNLFNVKLNQTLIDTFARVQYFLTQAGVVKLLNAPTSKLFEQQSNYFQTNVYAEQAQNMSQNISYFMRDDLDVKYYFFTGTLSFLTYYKATRSWLESLNFLEAAAFKNKTMDNITIDSVVVGSTKSVKQVTYSEIFNAGHYVFADQPAVVNFLLKEWVRSMIEEQGSVNLKTE